MICTMYNKASFPLYPLHIVNDKLKLIVKEHKDQICVEWIWRKNILIKRIFHIFEWTKVPFLAFWIDPFYDTVSLTSVIHKILLSNRINTTSSWHLSGILNVLSFDKTCSLDWKWLPHITFYRWEMFHAFQRHFLEVW